MIYIMPWVLRKKANKGNTIKTHSQKAKALYVEGVVLLSSSIYKDGIPTARILTTAVGQ